MKGFEGQNLAEESGEVLDKLPGKQINEGVEAAFVQAEAKDNQGEMSPEAAENKKTIRGALKTGVGDLMKAVMQNEIVQKIAMSPAFPLAVMVTGGVLLLHGGSLIFDAGSQHSIVEGVRTAHINASALDYNKGLWQLADKGQHVDFNSFALPYNNDSGMPVSFDQLMQENPAAAQADAAHDSSFMKGYFESVAGFMLTWLAGIKEGRNDMRDEQKKQKAGQN
jgi:hypothetical protein